MSKEEDRFAEALELTDELRHLIYQLRGEYISRMNNLERGLEEIILFYFGHKLPGGEFRSWLLSRITMQGKIEVIREILHSVGLREISPTYIQELKTANEYRNALAHSSVGPDLSIVEDEDSLKASLVDLHSIRSTRSGLRAVRVDGHELIDRIGRLKTITSWSIFVMTGVLAYTNDRDSLLSVRNMETGNPDVPRLTLPHQSGPR